jgi:hypothetical protein
VLGSLAKPADGLGIVLRHAFAFAIAVAEAELRIRLAAFGARADDLRCLSKFPLSCSVFVNLPEDSCAA